MPSGTVVRNGVTDRIRSTIWRLDSFGFGHSRPARVRTWDLPHVERTLYRLSHGTCGARARTRTWDLPDVNGVLSPLSHTRSVENEGVEPSRTIVQGSSAPGAFPAEDAGFEPARALCTPDHRFRDGCHPGLGQSSLCGNTSSVLPWCRARRARGQPSIVVLAARRGFEPRSPRPERGVHADWTNEHRLTSPPGGVSVGCRGARGAPRPVVEEGVEPPVPRGLPGYSRAGLQQPHLHQESKCVFRCQ